MRYKVVLEKSVLGSFFVEANDEDEAVRLAEADAVNNPNQFSEDVYDSIYLCEQWEIDSNGNETRIY